MSGVLHESWLGELNVGWDCVRKLHAFEERYLAWMLLLQDEILVQETKYFALHLFFLWDNGSQKLGTPLYFAKYEPPICTL